MRTHTSEFKEELKVFGRQIKGKITYYPSYDLVSESDDNILTEADLQIISEQANYEEAIEINEEDIFSISIIKNGDLLQSLMKEFDFETKVELNIGSVVNPQFGLLVNEEYEYLNYGNYIINSKEFNMDTETWSYVCYDKMLFSMIKYRGLSNVQYPITIKQFINNLCNKVGLEFEDNEFVNQNQLIYEDLYKNRDVTYRDIFDEISKIVAGNLLINDDDKLEVKYVNNLISKLPSEYTEVEYLESSGNQYIETDHIPTIYDSIETKFSANSTPSDKNLYGSRLNTNREDYSIWINTSANKGIAVHFPKTNLAKTNTQWIYTDDIMSNPVVLKVTPQHCYVNNEIKYTFTDVRTPYDGSIKAVLFAHRYNTTIQNKWSGKIYYFKIWTNDTLVRDFVPCRRNSDNVLGMYDLVDGGFYTNEGTGQLSAGKQVGEVINEEYLKDTNVRMSEKIGVINSVSILDSDNNLQYIAEDTQSIKENEMTRVTITDNLIAMNGETQEIADNILNKLNGLYYYANDLQTTGVCYYDFLDMFNVEARGNIYQCLLLNNEITITQGIEEHIFTERFEELETQSNEYTTSVISNKQVQFKINQQEGKIESKVEKDGVISAINQSAEEIQINANRLNFEGKTINLTGDNIKIKGDKLDIDSKGQITLFDDSAEKAFSAEDPDIAYIIQSTFNDEYQGQNNYLRFGNKIFANGRKNEYENNNEIQQSTGYGHYFGGIEESLYRYPMQRLYFHSEDYDQIQQTGSLQELNLSVNMLYFLNYNGSSQLQPIILNGSTGNIRCVSLTQTSKVEDKKNFEKLTNAKDILNQVDIYKYNFKDENDDTKKSIGFVIGDDFNYSKEITSTNNDGANIYSMVSVLWQVVKEQQEEIKELKEMIKNGKY